MKAKIVDGAVTDAKIVGGLCDDPAFSALFKGFGRLLELQEEYYRLHPFRRMLRNLGLLPDPDVKARMWALERKSEEEMS